MIHGKTWLCNRILQRVNLKKKKKNCKELTPEREREICNRTSMIVATKGIQFGNICPRISSELMR